MQIKLKKTFELLKALLYIIRVFIITVLKVSSIEFNFKWERMKLWLKEDSYNFNAVMPFWFDTYQNWWFFKYLRYIAIFFVLIDLSFYNLLGFYAWIYEYIWDPKDSIYAYIMEVYLVNENDRALAILEYIIKAYIFDSKTITFRLFVLYIFLVKMLWKLLVLHAFIHLTGRIIYFPDLYIYKDYIDVIIDPKDKYLESIKGKIIVEDFTQDTFEKREEYLAQQKKIREEEGEYFTKAWKELDDKEKNWDKDNINK